MLIDIIEAKYVRDFVVWVKFEDGTEGEIDLASELWGPVFEPLKNQECFRHFEVAEYGTIAWPNGAVLHCVVIGAKRNNLINPTRGSESSP